MYNALLLMEELRSRSAIWADPENSVSGGGAEPDNVSFHRGLYGTSLEKQFEFGPIAFRGGYKFHLEGVRTCISKVNIYSLVIFQGGGVWNPCPPPLLWIHPCAKPAFSRLG